MGRNRLNIVRVELDGLLRQEVAAVTLPILGEGLAGLPLKLPEKVVLEAARLDRMVGSLLDLS